MRFATLSGRFLAALGFLFLSAPALAGEVYTFTTDGRQEGPEFGTGGQGRILVEGTRYRIEYDKDDSIRPFHALVSKDGGEHEFALNLENRTYYELEKAPPGKATSGLFRLLPLPESALKGSVSQVKLDVAQAPEPETVSGIPARRHEITLSYNVAVEILPPPNLPFKGSSETVRGKVRLNAVYWMAEDRAPLPAPSFRPEIRTGFPEADERLAAALAALRGLAVKQQVTIAAEGDQGVASRSETSTKVIGSVRPAKTQPAMFEVPSGFKYHKPEIVRPSLGK